MEQYQQKQAPIWDTGGAGEGLAFCIKVLANGADTFNVHSPPGRGR